MVYIRWYCCRTFLNICFCGRLAVVVFQSLIKNGLENNYYTQKTKNYITS